MAATLVLVACTPGLAAGRAAPSAVPPAAASLPLPPGTQAATVVRHVDGDTVLLTGAGRGPLPGSPTKVRFLQIDTPEVFGTRQCYGPEASARTAQLLPVGAHVRVQADRQLLDRYGRTLLLLWDERGASVQETLVREGEARVLHVAPNDLGLAPLVEVQERARQAGRGLWGACPAPDRP